MRIIANTIIFMSFATLDFLLFFLIIFLGRLFLFKHANLYKIFLLNVSLFFYALFSVNFLVIILASVAVNYQFLFLLNSSSSQKSKKTLLWLGVLANIGFLGVYKYFNFFVDSFLELAYKLNFVVDAQVMQIVAPVGISFLTFRAISHLVDSYRGLKFPSIIDFTNYLLFFPHILAGPIARAKDFYEDLNNQKKFKINYGKVIVLVFSGLFKKLVVSSYLYSVIKEPFSNPEAFSSPELFSLL